MVNFYELPVLNTIPPKREMALALADIYAAREDYCRNKALAVDGKAYRFCGTEASASFLANVRLAYEIVEDYNGELAREYRLLQKFPLLLFLIRRSYLEGLLEEARQKQSLEAALAQPVQH